MSKRFREWAVEQVWLLPPSVQELVPADHVAHFIRDTIRELDISEIVNTYSEEKGYPPYHPVMMTALLLYAYCEGIYSLRRIAKSSQERVDCMAVTAMQRPDFRTISDFRKCHLAALGGLFRQVLRLCQRARIVRLGHVALDSTTIKANAAKDRSMSYKRMKWTEERLEQQIAGWFEKAQRADEMEDREFGPAKRGDELPNWVKSKQERL